MTLAALPAESMATESRQDQDTPCLNDCQRAPSLAGVSRHSAIQSKRCPVHASKHRIPGQILLKAGTNRLLLHILPQIYRYCKFVLLFLASLWESPGAEGIALPSVQGKTWGSDQGVGVGVRVRLGSLVGVGVGVAS